MTNVTDKIEISPKKQRVNVVAVVIHADGSKEVHETHNIVTYAGEIYYAQMAAGETPGTDFTSGGLLLGTGTSTPTQEDTTVNTLIAGSAKTLRSGYPKSDDDDSDNTGAAENVCTWAYSYSAGDVVEEDIAEGAIVDNTSTPTVALTHFLFDAPFDLSASDALKVFVNHLFSGSGS